MMADHLAKATSGFMQYIFDRYTLVAIWNVMQQAPRVQQLRFTGIIGIESLVAEWMGFNEMTDIILLFDDRLSYGIDLRKLTGNLGIRWERIGYCPRVNSHSPMDFDALLVEAAALLLILLVRLASW